jgi:hypothetical protein
MNLLVTNTVYGLFNSAEWKSVKVPTYPANFVKNITDPEYIRFNLLLSESALNFYNVGKRVFGILAISIFVESGTGEKRIAEIASHLDALLQYKVFENGLELGSSSVNGGSVDESNKSLYRANYSINITYIGE